MAEIVNERAVIFKRLKCPLIQIFTTFAPDKQARYNYIL